MRPDPKPDYSWRDAPDVPAFDDGRILLVMDGHCALCSAAATRIARWDRQDRVRIANTTSPLGASLLHHFGMDPDDPDTWLMLEDGQAYGSLDAMTRLFPLLRPFFVPLRVLRVLPFGLQDWLYARIARNRYRLFGRSDLCAMPDSTLRAKLVQ